MGDENSSHVGLLSFKTFFITQFHGAAVELVPFIFSVTNQNNGQLPSRDA